MTNNVIEYHYVSDQVVDNLIFVLDYLYSNKIGIPKTKYDDVATVNAFQTVELTAHDGEYKEFDEVLKSILIEVGRPHLEIARFHMVVYNGGGYQIKHDHVMEDQSVNAVGTFLLYLSDCDSGATVFEVEYGQQVEVLPKRGLLLWFPLDMIHYSKEVSPNHLKMIAAGTAMKVE